MGHIATEKHPVIALGLRDIPPLLHGHSAIKISDLIKHNFGTVVLADLSPRPRVLHGIQQSHHDHCYQGTRGMTHTTTGLTLNAKQDMASQHGH